MIFFGNYFCKIKDNLYFVVISKNACTSIKKYILDKYNIKYTNFYDLHKKIGFTENYFLTLVSNKDKLNGIKFAIYRDPLSRAISSYKHMKYKEQYRGYNINNFNEYIDLCKTHLNYNNPINCDEHIRRQSDYYKKDDVNYVIDINILNEFLKLFNVDIGFENISEDFPIEITNEQISIIRELYKNDYEILNYKNYIGSLEDLKNINIKND